IFILNVVLLLIGFNVWAQTTQTFSTSGSYSFTPPAGVTSVTIECWGGGGRGATLTSNGVGGGGGGGAYAKSVITVSALSSYTVNVGAGSNTTADGGDSWFGASTVLAKGGRSAGDNSISGGSGGSASSSTGTIKFDGGTGASGLAGLNSGG